MPEPVSEYRQVARDVSQLEDRGRRSAGLHGLYAAVGLLVGLLLPIAQVRYNQDETPERYTAFVSSSR